MIDRIKCFKGAHLRKEVHLSTVSGVASTKPEMVSYFDKKVKAIEVITTKSYQVNPWPGNREPVICETESGVFGNSVGLRNPGMEYVLPRLREIKKKMRCILNVSVSGNRPEDFITLVKNFDEVADSIELNFSCPHAAAGFGAAIGSDINIATEYVEKIRKACPDQKSALIIKLTPNVDNIGEIAKSVIDAGADGIAAINTVTPIVHKQKGIDEPILNNKLGGKGGQSGKNVHSRAIECIKEIRRAIGSEPIIYGMGGVFSGYDAASLVDAGADVVGCGSVLGKVTQKYWPEFLCCIKDEATATLQGKKVELRSQDFIRTYNEMLYTRHTVTKAYCHTKDILLLELDGTLDCHAGEFAFLWLPGKGEKPFSVAHNQPLTFLIRSRGEFTKALFDLKEGDTIYTRGLYGKPLEHVRKDNCLLIAGGSGVAVLPSVLRMIEKDGSKVEILVGTTAEVNGCDGKPLFADYFNGRGNYTVVADNGKPGRILDSIPEKLNDSSTTAAYLVGPEKFMAIAADRLLSLGMKKEDIYLSMERSTLCGIGLCGECVCGDRLTCQWGTFQRYDYLLENAPELLK
ncbi:MAG: dihydroorotate dehydrogenase [Spirochaetales bacterium]|nr:dihydroorotate dehydrogenase [Spirochaetales bacterium]